MNPTNRTTPGRETCPSSEAAARSVDTYRAEPSSTARARCQYGCRTTCDSTSVVLASVRGRELGPSKCDRRRPHDVGGAGGGCPLPSWLSRAGRLGVGCSAGRAGLSCPCHSMAWGVLPPVLSGCG